MLIISEYTAIVEFDLDVRRKGMTLDFVETILKQDVTLDWMGKVAPNLQNRQELYYLVDASTVRLRNIATQSGYGFSHDLLTRNQRR